MPCSACSMVLFYSSSSNESQANIVHRRRRRHHHHHQYHHHHNNNNNDNYILTKSREHCQSANAGSGTVPTSPNAASRMHPNTASPRTAAAARGRAWPQSTMCGTGHCAERCVCTVRALAVLDSQSSNAASRTYLNRAEHGRRPRAQPAAAVFRRCCVQAVLCSGGAVVQLHAAGCVRGRRLSTVPLTCAERG